MATFTDVLENLVTTAGASYQSYQSTQRGYTQLPGQPGTFVGPQGQIITATPLGATTTTSTTFLLLGVLVLVFFFAFFAIRKD